MTVHTLNGVQARAVDLVVNGHVGGELVGARVFPVRSSDGKSTYTVVVALDPDASACNCPAGSRGRTCKHIVAATFQAGMNDQEARETREFSPVREWDNDACRGCGTYIDPARGRSYCDDCTPVAA